MKRFLMALLVACVPLHAFAQPILQPLVHEAIVAAPVAQVWTAFTTGKGQESWMVAKSDVDLRIGGLMRTHYDPAGQLGDAKGIDNMILAFEPERMFSIKVARAPDTFPFPDAVKKMWTVIYFDAVPPASTRIRLVGLGFEAGDESQRMRSFFDRGNAYTLQQLQKHFAGTAAPAK